MSNGTELTRYLERGISEDALKARTMAFISGPRQVGKTTLGRHLLESRHNELSWDDQAFRKRVVGTNDLFSNSPRATHKILWTKPLRGSPHLPDG